MWGNKKPEAAEEQSAPAARPEMAREGAGNRLDQAGGQIPGGKTNEYRTRPAVRERAAGSSARLGASLQVKGEISGNEDLHIDGTVEGLIQLDDRKLTVGIDAKLTADVVAREIVVYGSVKGNLRARDRIEIKKDGSVVGDLTTARISIEDGAYFKGAIEIDRQALESGAGLSQPAYSRVSSTVSAD